MSLKIAACAALLIMPASASLAQSVEKAPTQPRDCMAMLAACFDAAGGEEQAERLCLSAYAEICMWRGRALEQVGLPGTTPVPSGALEGS